MTITHPNNIPTQEIDLEFPCGNCQIYKGGDDACLDCPVMTRWPILTGEDEPAYFCVDCDEFYQDNFYPPMFCKRCGGTLEYITERKQDE